MTVYFTIVLVFLYSGLSLSTLHRQMALKTSVDQLVFTDDIANEGAWVLHTDPLQQQRAPTTSLQTASQTVNKNITQENMVSLAEIREDTVPQTNSGNTGFFTSFSNNEAVDLAYDMPADDWQDASQNESNPNHTLQIQGLTDAQIQFTWPVDANEPYGTQAQRLFDVGIQGGVHNVAVLDSGISATIPDNLRRQLRSGYDFVSDAAISNDGDGRDPDPTEVYNPGSNCLSSSFHGTKTTSVIIGTNFSVAPSTYVGMMRVLGSCGQGYAADVTDAIEWATGGIVNGMPKIAKPFKILSMSFTGAGSCPSYLQAAIDHAVYRGATVVVAAGNSGKDASLFFPCNCAGVIVVGASTRDGSFASFSNFGGKVSISAPGYNVPVLQHDSSVLLGSGTSFATPHVSAMMSMGVPLFRKPFRAACTRAGGCGQGIITNEFDTTLRPTLYASSADSLQTTWGKTLWVFASTTCNKAWIDNGSTDMATCIYICNAGYELVNNKCVQCQPGKYKSTASVQMCVPQSTAAQTTEQGKTLHCPPGKFYVPCNTTNDATCADCVTNPSNSWWLQYETVADWSLASTYCNWKCTLGYFRTNTTTTK
jgi:hypothetical protein